MVNKLNKSSQDSKIIRYVILSIKKQIPSIICHCPLQKTSHFFSQHISFLQIKLKTTPGLLQKVQNFLNNYHNKINNN